MKTNTINTYKNNIAAITNIAPGKWFACDIESDVPLSAKGKKAGVHVVKYTHGTFRTGINYSATKVIRDKVEAGAYDDTAAHQLPWGKWVVTNRLIGHYNKAGEYNLYARMYSSPNKIKTKYTINGVPTTIEQLIADGYVNQSTVKKSGENTGVYSVNIANIVKLSITK